MDFLLSSLQNPFLGPIYAVIAGVLTSASPCSLAAIPLVIGHMAGAEGHRKTRHLLLFLLGMALSLTLVGILAGALGRSLVLTVPWLRPLAGIAFIVAGAAYMDLFGGKKTCKVNLPLDKMGFPEEDPAGRVEAGEAKAAEWVKRAEGVEGAKAAGSPIAQAFTSFSLGALYGVTASPCATPALLAILSLVAVTGSLWKGAFLLLAYSIGQSALILLAGLFTIKFKDFLGNQRNTDILEMVRKAGGVVIMAFGAYLLVRPYL